MPYSVLLSCSVYFWTTFQLFPSHYYFVIRRVVFWKNQTLDIFGPNWQVDFQTAWFESILFFGLQCGHVDCLLLLCFTTLQLGILRESQIGHLYTSTHFLRTFPCPTIASVDCLQFLFVLGLALKLVELSHQRTRSMMVW